MYVYSFDVGCSFFCFHFRLRKRRRFVQFRFPTNGFFMLFCALAGAANILYGNLVDWINLAHTHFAKGFIQTNKSVEKSRRVRAQCVLASKLDELQCLFCKKRKNKFIISNEIFINDPAILDKYISKNDDFTTIS